MTFPCSGSRGGSTCHNTAIATGHRRTSEVNGTTRRSNDSALERSQLLGLQLPLIGRGGGGREGGCRRRGSDRGPNQ